MFGNFTKHSGSGFFRPKSFPFGKSAFKNYNTSVAYLLHSPIMETQIIKEELFFLHNSSHQRYFVRSFFPSSGEPKGILQISHGMAEHSGRYMELCEFLAQNGYAAFVSDHPGHGQTAGNIARLGHLPRSNGWESMLENMRALYTHIRQNHSQAPVFILGHSMGSALARHFTAIYPVYIQGLLLSGTFETSRYLLWLSQRFIGLQTLLLGEQYKSKWFNGFFYYNYNRHFTPKPTNFEWISSERSQVDQYVADPYCGFPCTNAFFSNLFKGIAAMKKTSKNLKYRRTLPVLIFGGQDDPVGNFGRDAKRIHREFLKQRFQNLRVEIFPGRHEILHEPQKEKVFFLILNWMEQHLQTR